MCERKASLPLCCHLRQWDQRREPDDRSYETTHIARAFSVGSDRFTLIVRNTLACEPLFVLCNGKLHRQPRESGKIRREISTMSFAKYKKRGINYKRQSIIIRTMEAFRPARYRPVPQANAKFC